MTKRAGRYDQSVAFLRNLDADWARLIDLVGPCLHDPKAAREPYEALIRAIAYQQLTAKDGDAHLLTHRLLIWALQFERKDRSDGLTPNFYSLSSNGFTGDQI